jgi:hypothetical protein
VECLKRFLLACQYFKWWPVILSLKFLLIGSPALYGRVQLDAWQGPTSSWFMPSNWSLGAPPLSSQNALVNNGTTAQIAASGAVASTLTIGGTAAGSTVQMQPRGSLGSSAAPANIVIGQGGTLRFSGGLSNGVNLGGTVTSNGIQNNGNIVFDGSLDHVMGIPVTGSGNFFMAGTGTLTANANVGDSLNVLVNSGVLIISANDAITSGTISVNGGTAQIAATGESVTTLSIGTTASGSTLQLLPGGAL